MTCIATHVTTAAEVQTGHIINAATVNGTAPDGKVRSGSDTATVTVVHAPAISLAKTPEPANYVASGETITYTYLVTNSGNVTLSRITLTDNKLGSIRCPGDFARRGRFDEVQSDARHDGCRGAGGPHHQRGDGNRTINRPVRR